MHKCFIYWQYLLVSILSMLIWLGAPLWWEGRHSFFLATVLCPLKVDCLLRMQKISTMLSFRKCFRDRKWREDLMLPWHLCNSFKAVGSTIFKEKKKIKSVKKKKMSYTAGREDAKRKPSSGWCVVIVISTIWKPSALWDSSLVDRSRQEMASSPGGLEMANLTEIADIQANQVNSLTRNSMAWSVFYWQSPPHLPSGSKELVVW